MHWRHICMIHKPTNSNSEMQQSFCKRLKLNRCSYYDRPVSLEKLLKGSRHYNTGLNYDNVPTPEDWKDHLEIYKEQGTSRIILASQPYKKPKELLSVLTQLASKLQIRVVIFDKKYSWYYQNATCLVLLMSENTYESSKEALSDIGDYWNINFLK